MMMIEQTSRLLSQTLQNKRVEMTEYASSPKHQPQKDPQASILNMAAVFDTAVRIQDFL